MGAVLQVPETERDNSRTKKLRDCKQSSMRVRFGDRLDFDKRLTFNKADSILHSNIKYDEEQPPHLIINNKEEFQKSNIKQFELSEESFCPAGVYKLHIDINSRKSLRIEPEKCIHCKSCGY